MKRKRIAAVAELAAVLLITALLFRGAQAAALIERGYTAHGGECLILLLPALYYSGRRIAADWLTTMRRDEEDEDNAWQTFSRSPSTAFVGGKNKFSECPRTGTPRPVDVV